MKIGGPVVGEDPTDAFAPERWQCEHAFSRQQRFCGKNDGNES